MRLMFAPRSSGATERLQFAPRLAPRLLRIDAAHLGCGMPPCRRQRAVRQACPAARRSWLIIIKLASPSRAGRPAPARSAGGGLVAQHEMDKRVPSGMPGTAADRDQFGPLCLPFLAEAAAVYESDQYRIVGGPGYHSPGAVYVVVGASFETDGVRVDQVLRYFVWVT
jgi:hypothetical protein